MTVYPNIFKPRNDWGLTVLNSRKNSTFEHIEYVIDREIKRETGVDPKQDRAYRGRKYVMARQLYIVFMLNYTKETYESIGNKVGKDHSTVNTSITAVDNMRTTDKIYRAMYDRIDNKLKNL